MPSTKVHFFEVFEEEERSLRAFAPPEWNCTYMRESIQESGLRHPPCEVISIRTQSMIPDAWSPGLRAILSRSAGFDHLQSFARRTGSSVQTGHLFRYSGRAVAEQAALLWLALLRKLPTMQRAMRSFSRDGLTGRECAGRTLAVIGAGDIGRHVAEVARGLGMKPLAVDVVERHADLRYVTRDEALAAADVVVCAMNLTRDNHEYFSESVLRLCRPGAIFINVARGEFARSSILLKLLEQGHLGGVGLDVFYDEPVIGPALRSGALPPDAPEISALLSLLRREDAILTPHNAFNTVEAVERKSAQTVAQLKHFFARQTFSTHALTESL